MENSNDLLSRLNDIYDKLKNKYATLKEDQKIMENYLERWRMVLNIKADGIKTDGKTCLNNIIQLVEESSSELSKLDYCGASLDEAKEELYDKIYNIYKEIKLNKYTQNIDKIQGLRIKIESLKEKTDNCHEYNCSLFAKISTWKAELSYLEKIVKERQWDAQQIKEHLNGLKVWY